MLFSCSPYKRDSFEYRGNANNKLNDQQKDKKFYIDNFKDKVFCNCLMEGFKENKLGDSIFHLMAKKDLFTLSDDIDLKRDSLVKKLGIQVIKNMPPLSVYSEIDISDKNFVLSSCLRYFESRELDSTAIDYYKKRQKEEKKLWGSQ